MSSEHRAELIAAIQEAGRDQAGRGVMLHQAIAERFGLNSTDFKCLDLARNEPELTAGRIAAATKLSTSAVTAVLDRLERRGFIARQRDPADRRKVVVVSTGKHEAEAREIFDAMGRSFAEILADYDDGQLATVLEFTIRTAEVARDFTAELTAEPGTDDVTRR